MVDNSFEIHKLENNKVLINLGSNNGTGTEDRIRMAFSIVDGTLKVYIESDYYNPDSLKRFKDRRLKYIDEQNERYNIRFIGDFKYIS